MIKKEIGIARVTYDAKGTATHSIFIPQIKIDNSELIQSQLKNIGNGSKQTILENAQLVMAHWFTKVGEIETADRFAGEEVVGEVMGTDERDGKIRSCTMKFYLQKP